MIVWGGMGWYELSQHRWTLQPLDKHMDGHKHDRRTRCLSPSHGGVTGTEMIVWGMEWYESYQHRWTLQPLDKHMDGHKHDRRTRCPKLSHGGVDGHRDDCVGGWNGTSYFKTGGRYNPSTNTWTATSTTGAPSLPGNSHGGVDGHGDDCVGGIWWHLFQHRWTLQPLDKHMDGHKHDRRTAARAYHTAGRGRAQR